jgi:hypothetical protein
MFADTERRCRGFEHRRRAFAGVGLVALAAALLVAGPATAAAAPGDATVFVQSGKSGKLGGGRLVLGGVSGRASWATNTGRAGVISLRRLHRRLIPPGKPATGTLHIAGQRGGQEQAFRLSRPRYNPARHTVAYRAKPLRGRRAARAAGFRRFGAASLSIIPHRTLTGAFDPTDNSSLAIDNSATYPCAQSSKQTGNPCWGTLSGSGLRPGAQWTVWNAIRSVSVTGTVPSNGSLDAVPVNFLCGQPLTESIYAVSTTSAGQSIRSPTVNRPAGC